MDNFSDLITGRRCLTRRDFLWRVGGGFGGLAMAHLLARDAAAFR